MNMNDLNDAMNDLNNSIKDLNKTTDWLIRSIPGWERLKLKEFTKLCGYLKLSFSKSKFTEKEWSKMMGIKKRTVHKLLHDPVPKMDIETYFKLRYYFRLYVPFVKREENENENS